MEKQLRYLAITDEYVKIAFVESDFIAGSGEGEEQDDDKVQEHLFTVKSMLRPHKDLSDSMKKLRRLALEVLEINLAETKDYSAWNVTAINIAGSVTLQKCRLVMTLSKKVKLTGKECPIKTPQITLFPDAEDKVKFPFADKIAPIIEDIIEECWSYLNGKSEDEGQYALFPNRELIEK